MNSRISQLHEQIAEQSQTVHRQRLTGLPHRARSGTLTAERNWPQRQFGRSCRYVNKLRVLLRLSKVSIFVVGRASSVVPTCSFRLCHAITNPAWILFSIGNSRRCRWRRNGLYPGDGSLCSKCHRLIFGPEIQFPRHSPPFCAGSL